MTYKEIKNFIAKFNPRYELNPIIEKYRWFNPISCKFEEDAILVGWELGICNIAGRKGQSEWQWTWFKFHNDNTDESPAEPADDTDMFFIHRYSQVNGHSYKGVKEWLAAEATIERRMAK